MREYAHSFGLKIHKQMSENSPTKLMKKQPTLMVDDQPIETVTRPVEDELEDLLFQDYCPICFTNEI